MFFKLRNLSSPEVSELDKPWEVDTSRYPLHLDKSDYRAHYTKKSADHCLISGVEGLSKYLRVKSGKREGSGNPPKKIHAYIADYDGVFVPELIEKAKIEPPSPYLPAWVCETHSHRVRYVWLFENPITVSETAYADAFLKMLKDKVKASKWAADLDPVGESCTQYYDIGRGWQKFSDYVIPTELLQQWDFDLTKSWVKSHEPNATEIPFDKIRDEILARFPGRHTGPVQEGARCLRFWDSTSDNPTGCTIHSWGVRVFVGKDKPRMYWKDIFGNEFVEEFKSLKTMPIVNSLFFFTEKHEFYRFNKADGTYYSMARKDVENALVSEGGLCKKPPSAKELSEVDTAIHYIVHNRYVGHVLPILYNPHGVIRKGCTSERILNTCMVRTVMPGEVFTDPLGASSWDCMELMTKCPFIYPYITALFCDTVKEYDDWRASGKTYTSKNLQLNLFLSWLSYFYVNSLNMAPAQGQALCLAGHPGTGKTCLANAILGPLMGGVNDAKSFFVDGRQFTNDVSGIPVLTLNDVEVSQDYKLRVAYSNRVKAVVANGALRYEKKFGDIMGALEYNGRIIITNNLSAQAITAIPTVTEDTADKFIFLKTGPKKSEVLKEDKSANALQIAMELPAFARFLTHFKIPEDCKDPNNRFGVRGWQHPELLRLTASNISSNTVLEALALIFSSDYRKAASKAGIAHWTGTALQLFQKIQAISAATAREIGNAYMLTRALEALMQAGYDIKRSSGTKQTRFRIGLDIVTEEGENDGFEDTGFITG